MIKQIVKAYKTEMYPNNKKKTLCRKNCGAARWAFNFALERKKAAFDKKEKIPNAVDIYKEVVVMKRDEINNPIPWACKLSKCSVQEGIRDCETAFNNFFRRCKEGKPGKKGFPKFKSRYKTTPSCRLYGSISVKNGYIKLPKIGRVKLAENDYIPTDAEIISATISSRAGKWFVSVQVSENVETLPIIADKVVGIDLGISKLATCSDGVVFENPKALKTNLKKLKRFNKIVSRRAKKRGCNYKKAKDKLAKLHYHISNIRREVLHKVTTTIIKTNQNIVLEKLNVAGMLKTHYMAQAISDVGMFEFKRMLEYKAGWAGRNIQYAKAYYPSSKTCCKCGWKNDELKLSARTFTCEQCNNVINRDLNAAKNLEKLFDPTILPKIKIYTPNKNRFAKKPTTIADKVNTPVKVVKPKAKTVKKYKPKSRKVAAI